MVPIPVMRLPMDNHVEIKWRPIFHVWSNEVAMVRIFGTKARILTTGIRG